MKKAAGMMCATLLAACGQGDKPEPEAQTPADPASPPVAANHASQCPEADENGRIAIFDGLQATVLDKGYGRVAVLGDNVTVGATLWVYDAAAEGGKGDLVWDAGDDGFSFDIGSTGFIDGWSPGVACMRLGERRALIIASRLAYGEAGRAPIPPNADIIYELELRSILEPADSASPR